MVSKYPILLVKVVLDFFYYIIRCYLLIDIKNPVNVWWNEKYLVPLHQN